jgi:hypothetical protein
MDLAYLEEAIRTQYNEVTKFSSWEICDRSTSGLQKDLDTFASHSQTLDPKEATITVP